MAIQAVLFDMDGVIIDSEPIHFETDKLTMKEYGIEVTDSTLSRYIGIANSQMWGELREEFRLTATVAEILALQEHYKVQLFGNPELGPISGIPELLENLKRHRIKTGLASSSTRAFIGLILEKLNIRDYFKAVVSGEEVHRSKPEPEIFLKAAGMLDTEPEDCIVIEDSVHGIQAARAAGMTCIGYRNPSYDSQDLTLADYVVDSIQEAEKIILSLI